MKNACAYQENTTDGVCSNSVWKHNIWKKSPLNISFVCLDILWVILCDDSVHKNDVVSLKTPIFISISM